MLINYTDLMNEKFNTKNVIVYQHEADSVCLDKFLHVGDKCIRISSKRSHPIRNIIDSIKVIHKEKPDILHAHIGFLNFIPLICAFLCGIKVRISHSHVSNDNTNTNIEEKTIKVFKIINILFSNKLLACGYSSGKCMYGNKKFKVVYNSVNIDKFIFDNRSRIKIRKELKLNDDDILIGNVGRFTDQKNQLFLLDVMKNLVHLNSKFKLIILGNGELKKTITNKVIEYQLEDNVLIHDPVGNIEEYYDAMDAFALPSLYEGFPVSLVEAQVSGLTSFVSDTIDPTSKINDDVFFLDNGDVNQWVQSILTKVEKKRKVNIDKFERFNISTSYIKLYDIYKKLIDKKGVKNGNC